MARRVMTAASVLAAFVGAATGGAAVPRVGDFLLQAAPQRDAPVQQAQPRRIPVGTGSITGVVVSAETGRPLRNVQVSLSGTAGSQEPDGRGVATSASPGVGARSSGPAGTGAATGAAGPNAAQRDGGAGYATLSISRSATTTEQGQFSFTRLAAGRYTVNVSRDMYLQWISGQKTPGGRGKPLPLEDGQQVSLTIPLVRGGVIAGRIFDEDGEPVRNVQIAAWRFNSANGVKRLQQSNSAQTDDRGSYRLINLQPGDYLVGAMPRNTGGVVNEQVASDRALIEGAIASAPVQQGARPGYPAYVTVPPVAQPTGGTRIFVSNFLPVFFPGTTTASAATNIHVTGGDVHEPFDIPLQFVPSTTLQGVVTGTRPQGAQLMVSLSNTDPMVASSNMTTGISADDGKFTMQNVAPGRYRLLAQSQNNVQRVVVDGVVTTPAPAADVKPVWAAQDIFVDGQPTLEVTLVLQPGRTMSGTVVFDTLRPPAAGQLPTVNLANWVGFTGVQLGALPTSPVDGNGRFTLTGVVPGVYVVRGPTNMRSAMFDGRDLLDFPLEFKGDRDISGIEITVTDKRTDLGGTVTDAANRPLSEYVVVVAAVDSSFWIPGSRRIAMARTGPVGRYRFQQLPPGRYVVGVVAELDEGMQYDPEFLKSLSAAGRVVTLADDVPVKQDFRAAAP